LARTEPNPETGKSASRRKRAVETPLQIAESRAEKSTRMRDYEGKLEKTPDAPEPETFATADTAGYEPEEYERLMGEYEDTLRDITEGEVVKGTVLGVSRDDVIVDVGFKSEGVIDRSEFTEIDELKPGMEIDVYLEAVEDSDGQIVLSKQKADFMRVWERIRDSYENGSLVPGIIQRRIKGGMVVDLLGVDAFLPGSQVALRQVSDFDGLIGQTMEFRIIKLNKNRRNIVVSRRVVLEEERASLRSGLLAELEVGQVREGVVKNITDFGAFIDLGGVDGLCHITDMSWGRVRHPSEVVSIGDEVSVKVLDYQRDRNRISLGMKQLTPRPWEDVDLKYPVGSRVTGKVVSITDYGAFVELEKGVEGLVHVSEMSWTQHVKHPSKLISVGDMVEVIVLSVDKENEKISLGMKQVDPDPWLTLDERFPAGSQATGTVRNLTNFGAFVELEDGIDGLVHISDMSWTKRVHHPGEVMKKGDQVDVVVLSIDKENRRISLGYKQTGSDPWPSLGVIYAVGTETMGTIVRLLDRGVVVNLPEEVEGFVPLNHLGRDDISRPAEAFTEGEVLPLRVIEFDQHARKIVLSVQAYYASREKTELDEFVSSHPKRSVGLSEVVGDALADIAAVADENSGEEETEPEGRSEEEETRASEDS
jgi:small subunit ribosomal protein S1